MKTFQTLSAVFLIGAGLAASARAESAAYSRTDMSILLQRDASYEQTLRILANPDQAITPARVLRWMSGLMGYRQIARPSNLEFQPVLRVRDSQKEIVAQIAYKF